MDSIVKFEQKPKAVSIDLDGTLSLPNGRNPYDGSRCDSDLLNFPVYEVAHGLFLKGYSILFVSGREDRWIVQTVSFLSKHLTWYHENIMDSLYMRKSGDYRDDRIVKEEMYQDRIFPHYEVVLVLDDRGKVVKHIRGLGLTVFQVAPGDFDKEWEVDEARRLLCERGFTVISSPEVKRMNARNAKSSG
jgi:hypothetical protein